MAHIFLSPHFDDAVYSCGGTIYNLAQNGHDVIIFTLMAGEPNFPIPDTPVLQDNHARWQVGDNPIIARKQEDTQASAILGATTRYFDLADCIYRVVNGEALYPSEDSLWTNIHPNDPAIKHLDTLTFPEGDVLYAPLGVGEHVDHLIVRDWAWKLAQNTDFTVKFYVEYPYLRNHEKVEHAYKVFPADLNRIKLPFSEKAMQRKIQAMRAYQSQIKSFWADASDIDGEVRETFTVNEQFVEEFAESN
ncbi:MAG: PIG-L family deacetylase [Phototrophicaceae bacterium]